MASMTACGFCAVAALSRYTSGLPWIFCFRTGKSSRILSTSNAVATALVSVLMEFLKESGGKRLSQGLDLDAVDDVLRERGDQQVPRIDLADAARLQVEHHFRIELADGRAVRAAHVV